MDKYVKILDWYIIKKFLSTFFFTVLIFLMVAVILDFSEKVEKFIEEPITKKEIILQYYPSFMLWIGGQLWSVCTLIAVIFFTSRMAYSSEIISIFNAGVSFNRLMRSYFFAAAFLTLLYLLCTHLVMPIGETYRQGITRKYIDKNDDKGKSTNIHLFVAPGTKVFIGFYRKDDSSARDFRIEHFKNQKLVSYTKADRAEYIPETKKWRLWDYSTHNFDALKEKLDMHISESKDTTLSLFPEDFVDYSSQQSMMITPRLMRYIRQQIKRGAGNTRKYEFELYRRTADPVTIFILTFIGMAIASRKVRGGFGFHLALGIGIGAIFVFLSKFTNVFALGQTIPVWLGAWLPNIVFSFVAFRLIQTAQK
jgi:lipopolysaccharide export system permease protein